MSMKFYWMVGAPIRRFVLCMRALMFFNGDIARMVQYDDENLKRPLCRWLYRRRLRNGQQKIMPNHWEQAYRTNSDCLKITWRSAYPAMLPWFKTLVIPSKQARIEV